MPRCRNRTCYNSLIIQHIDGNTMNNNRNNLACLGYLPIHNHAHRDDCKTISAYASLPVLTRNQCDALRASGLTTDIDAREA
jgi:hypothetical protein